MFKKGEKIHYHDGTVQTVRGRRPRLRKGGLAPRDGVSVRGFVRGALVDPDGTEHLGDWHENTITKYGHEEMVRAWAGLTGFSAASYIALGWQSASSASSDIVDKATMISEWGSASTSTDANSGSRRIVPYATISQTYSLTQTVAWAATDVKHSATVNAVGMANAASVGAGSLMSMAIFASSTKGTTQALNVTYNFVFTT